MRDPVPEGCILIDDLGRELRWPDECRRVASTYRDPDFDFPDYAARNLGFVMITERKGSLRIRFRPAFAGHRTIMSLLSFAARRTESRAAISYFGSAWRHEVCAGPSLQQRLAEISSDPAEAADMQPYLAVPRRISVMLHDADNPFAPVLRRWLDNMQPEGLVELLASCRLYDRSMIVERKADSGHFVFRHSGRAIGLYPSGWAQRAIGRPLHDQPDHAYGRWIAEACRAVDDRQVPRYELITASVSPDDGGSPRRWRYERLMLPWRDASGRHLVVSVSLRDEPRGRPG
jgi:hypothetical protein